MIAKLIRKNYSQLSSGSQEYDILLNDLCFKNPDFHAFIFTSILFIIFVKKGFGEWTDFWYEMGERLYSEDAYDPDDDETPDDDDDNDLLDFE